MFRHTPQRNTAVMQNRVLSAAKPSLKTVAPGALSVLHVATLNQPIKAGLGYGPIETIIYNIDKGLHSAGHRSIVACSADSCVTGEHYITTQKADGRYCADDTPRRRLDLANHLALAFERANRGDIDVIHLHDADAVEFFYNRKALMRIPMVLTLHVAAEASGLADSYRHWARRTSPPQVTCIAISEHQRGQYRQWADVDKVVHHGIDLGHAAKPPRPRDTPPYLFTIGRVTPDKGQDKAIELARRAGCKLIIAGCVQNKAADRAYFASLDASIDLKTQVDAQPVDANYYEQVIKPLISGDQQIVYIGEVNGDHKAQWYQHALATVFPIQWDEPFGLVLIESMAMGTPVIAFDRGAVPELVVQGKTGFVVDSMSAMVGAVGWVDELDRNYCRQHVRRNFSIAKMTAGYADAYRQVVHGQKTRHVSAALLNETSLRPTPPLVTCPV